MSAAPNKRADIGVLLQRLVIAARWDMRTSVIRSLIRDDARFVARAVKLLAVAVVVLPVALALLVLRLPTLPLCWLFHCVVNPRKVDACGDAILASDNVKVSDGGDK